MVSVQYKIAFSYTGTHHAAGTSIPTQKKSPTLTQKKYPEQPTSPHREKWHEGVGVSSGPGETEETARRLVSPAHR